MNSAALFRDRADAGRKLGEHLAGLKLDEPVVIAIPRGGAAVGNEVARTLSAPLDVIAVRKVGAPLQPEYAIGAVAEGGVVHVNSTVVESLGIGESELDRMVLEAKEEIDRRAALYREGRPLLAVEGRTVVLVDDGIATGLTAIAAARALRRAGAARVLLAVPVGPADAARKMVDEVDEFVCPYTPPDFFSVGTWYQRFPQLSDKEVAALLGDARRRMAGPRTDEFPPQASYAGSGQSGLVRREAEIPVGPVRLSGDLAQAPESKGLVIFAHGSGSSRLSPRNIEVATVLNEAGLATLLYDLLTPREATDRSNVFDIPLLGERLSSATRWARDQAEICELPLGYFGASTGAAAALWAAAELGEDVGAVVSRGGRPDLAEPRLSQVTAPTLLIVGGNDLQVLDLNRDAMRSMRCAVELAVVPGATHLFEEPGALDEVARLAIDWFDRNL